MGKLPFQIIFGTRAACAQKLLLNKRMEDAYARNFLWLYCAGTASMLHAMPRESKTRRPYLMAWNNVTQMKNSLLSMTKRSKTATQAE